MNFKLDKLIQEKQINLFLLLSFFFIFFSFIISKGFISNEELSDKFFLISSIFLIEIVYLALSNKFINLQVKNFKENITLLIIFLLIYLIWNSESILSFFDIFLFFILHLCFVIPLLIFINPKYIYSLEEYKLEKFILIGILTFFFSGLFYEINYSSTKESLILLFLSFIILSLNFLLKKCNKWFDILLSLIIFLSSIKIFLLSSEKDSFHYSWVLGSINSLNEYHGLLDNVVSQYGYFNILIISKLAQFFNIESSFVLVGFIIFLFIIFYVIFLNKILRLINLSLVIITTFLSFLIFGYIGYADFVGSMFIPSSSVFRFLPSLLTIILFTEVLKNNAGILNRIIFYFFFIISLIWSFESAFFTMFSLSSFFITKLIFNLFNFSKKKIDIKLFLSKFKVQAIIGFSLSIIIFLYFKDKSIFLFYEHALNPRSSLSVEITNNKLTLSFMFLLLLGYLIMRDSFVNKNFFYYNIIWFSLFISYSAYFLVRSVDNNILNILPFLLFIICSMKINSKQIEILRKTSLYVVIFILIISTVFSSIQYREKLINRLFSTKLLITPTFLDKNYLPHSEILNSIKKYKNLPLTLITGNTIHNPNINLPSLGYGLPILPLEQFNVLKVDTKQKLMDRLFNINKRHLILCLFECEFSYSNQDSNFYSKVFLGKKVKFKKIIEINENDKKEVLYLLSEI
tara:strand:+ start:821 stop:2881 length:2061 start_codon:yes stop_codon:yes gene_type:complete